MKKIILISIVCLGFLNAVDCTKELQKLENQILKTKQTKKPNELKIKSLQNIKEKLEKSCVDNKIDTKILKEIKLDENYIYDNSKLEKDIQKLDESIKKLEDKKETLIQKQKDLKQNYDASKEVLKLQKQLNKSKK